MTTLLSDREKSLEIFESLKTRNVERPELINARLLPEYTNIDFENNSVTVEFPVQDWIVNLGGFLHGGIIATMLDHAAGIAVCSFVGYMCPVINFNITYLHSAYVGESVYAVGKIINSGKTIINVESKLYNKSTGAHLATGNLTIFNKGHDASVK